MRPRPLKRAIRRANAQYAEELVAGPAVPAVALACHECGRGAVRGHDADCASKATVLRAYGETDEAALARVRGAA